MHLRLFLTKKKLIADWKTERENQRVKTNGKSLVLKAAESEDDIYNTIAGDVDDKVDSKSVEERVAAKLRLAKWKADRLEKEEKMKVYFYLY
jgi:hypothetical protein